MELKENDNDNNRNKINENSKEDGIESNNKPEFFLLIRGIAGKNTYGKLIRSASAFDCKEIYLLGVNKNITKKFFGNHGTSKKMKYKFFDSIESLKNHCSNNDIIICGVNICYKKIEGVIPIQKIDFKNKKTLFILGNNLNKINKELEDIINIFTYVDQGTNINEGEEHDLNVCVVGSIVMHYFGVKNGYKMARLNTSYNEEKFVVKTKKEYEENDSNYYKKKKINDK